ncbi:polysaccharide deacetylase family protein [Cerasicoccus maritimus]|uniref:polysaccharide deacetylase family protein n=1 Tax=Cerasicoccus maritimus TaxID=490089 RepID=UPI002852C8DE|nr:polysaccharide deacetylase family protein [Cerasicoccus maritimus]
MKGRLLAACIGLKLTGLLIVWGAHMPLLGWTVFFLCGGGLAVAHLVIPQWQGVCDVVTAFDSGQQPAVWLTIDDGPDPEDTPRLLELLAKHQARATFFLIGERAAHYPELVQQIRDAGHELGCHTYSHPRFSFWRMGPRAAAAEIDRALPFLEATRGEVTLFRPAVGIKNLWLNGILKARKLHCVAWTIRSGDGLGRDPQAIIRHVANRARPGAIILMHEGPEVAGNVRLAAIAGVLESLSAQGYAFILPTEDQFRFAPVKFTTTPTSTKELLCN